LYSAIKSEDTEALALSQFTEAATNKIHHWWLVRWWNKCVKPLPVDSWSRFVNVHLYHSKEWFNLHMERSVWSGAHDLL